MDIAFGYDIKSDISKLFDAYDINFDIYRLFDI